MYLDHRVIAKIAKIFAKTDMNIMLLDNNGQVILPADNYRDFVLPEELRKNPTAPLPYGSFTLIGTEGAQPLFLCLPGSSKGVQDCAVVCAELVSLLLRVEMPPVNREQTMYGALVEGLKGLDLESRANECGIPINARRCVLLFHLRGEDVETALNVLRNVIEEEKDIVVEIDRQMLALVKAFDGTEEYEEMTQLANAIQDTLENETSHIVDIGIGLSKETLEELKDSYEEAKKALDVGRVYRRDTHVYSYRGLLLERFLSDLPKEMCRTYMDSIFGDKSIRLFNDEMLHTIEMFFKNNLNLSETARQIFIHRNTLVYRLDKIQRTIGLDLRKFDDAVTFKLIMLLGKSGARNKYE
ncbi:MAG: PucR family transcriptional regulator [Christensenellales bacterium]